MTTFTDFLADQRGYRRIFVEEYGPWPHNCYFCGGEVDGHTRPIDTTAALVHHIDGDHGNDDPMNLAPAHWACHTTYHHTGRRRGSATRAKMSAAKAGSTQRPRTSEHRAAISAALTGVPKSPEHRAALSAARKGKWSAAQRAAIEATFKGKPLSPEHRAKLSAAHMGRLVSSETRSKLSARLEGNTNAAGKTLSPEHRAKMSATKLALPYTSCVKCRREVRVGTGLVLHLRACLEAKP